MTATMINPAHDQRPIGIHMDEEDHFDNTPYVGKRFVVLHNFLGRTKKRGDIISTDILPNVDFARLIGGKAIRLANSDEWDKKFVEIKDDDTQHLSWEGQVAAKDRQIEGLQKQLNVAQEELNNSLQMQASTATVQPTRAIMEQVLEKDKTIESLNAQVSVQALQIAKLSAQVQQMQQENGNGAKRK